MIKLVAFDLDGTIGETVPMCIKAFELAVSPYAGHALSREEIIQTFGLNEIGMIKMVAGEKWREALNDFYPVYEKMHAECPNPYEGIHELINTLKSKGVLVALITGKGEKSCMMTLEKFGMKDIFCAIKTGAEDRPNKTESISELLEAYHVANDEFYYVGDAVSDVEASRKAGVACLSAAWGTTVETARLEEVNPSNVFFTISDLQNFLC